MGYFDLEDDTAIFSDEDWNDLEELYFLLTCDEGEKRKPKWTYRRIDWEHHIEEKLATGTFQATYHMTLQQFNTLVGILREQVEMNEMQSLRSTGGNEPISPEVCEGTVLRFLYGSRVVDLVDIYGISPGSVNRIINKCLCAVVDSDHELLAIRLPDPTNYEELYNLSRRWEALSTSCGLLNGHLAAKDGWLAETEMPVDVLNRREYYSGHYKCYGLNVQAMVGPDLEFFYVCIAAPGKTNDVRAIKRCKGLIEWLQALPNGYFISGDNAYIISRKVLVPHDKPQCDHESKRVFNYYLSQLRIRVEMAFGLLTTKFRLLRKGLNFYNEKNSLVIRACAKLHNFCIRTKEGEGDGFGVLDRDAVRNDPKACGILPLPHKHSGQTYDMGYLETVIDEEMAEIDNSMPVVDIFVSDPSLRNELVADIRARGLRRPQENISRNS